MLALCCAYFLLSGTTHAVVSADAADAVRPNIIVILADDLGSGDVQCLNPGSRIPTPRLNEFAAAGMNFTDAHTPSAVCTPTRYGLLTGRYCWRTRLKRGVLGGYSQPLIQDERVTLAEFLKSEGYYTGIIGKWHLGLGYVRSGEGEKAIDYSQPLTDGPHTHGFDESLIVPASLDMAPYIYIKNGHVTQVPELTQEFKGFPRFVRQGPRSADFVIDNVLDDIANNVSEFVTKRSPLTQGSDGKPFFLYVPLTGPHKPVWPHPRFVGQTELGPYGDFVTQVDATVGVILDAVEKAGVSDNTLIVFTSDNGSFMHRTPGNRPDHLDKASVQGYHPENHTANGPYRGTKADIWEAGHRVPFFVRWPAIISPETTCGETVCQTDIFATCAAILQAEIPSNQADDSYSMLPMLRDPSTGSTRPPVVHHSINGTFAIREGKWKLVLSNGSGGREKPTGKPFEKPYKLFDMSADVSEKNDVIAEYPEVAAKLEAALEGIRNQP